MPFDMDLNKKETVATPQDQELFERENGDFKELPPDIEIKPEPLAYDDEANEAGAADLIARIEQGQAVLDKAAEIEQNIATPFKEFSKQVEQSNNGTAG